MQSPAPTPAPLSRFPAEVRSAYERFSATGDAVALAVVVEAALADFMPRGRAPACLPPFRSDLRLIEDLGFDSLAVAETAFFFEDLFQVAIHNEDLGGLRSVGDLQAFVLQRLQRTSAA